MFYSKGNLSDVFQTCNKIFYSRLTGKGMPVICRKYFVKLKNDSTKNNKNICQD
jgi:hypothetical protein